MDCLETNTDGNTKHSGKHYAYLLLCLRCPMRTPIFALNVRGNAPALTNLVVVVRAMRHNSGLDACLASKTIDRS